MDRRKEREFALKVLYANEFNDIATDTQIEYLKQTDQETPSKFSLKIIDFYTANKSEYDELIKSKLKGWKFERVAVIDRILLRIALVEFLNFEDIPPKVTMDEMIEIGKMYSTEKSINFINGILDALLKQLKIDNRVKKSGRGLVA